VSDVSFSDRVARARAELETQRHLGALPVTRAAAERGAISAEAAAAVAAAATADPGAEAALLELAATASLHELRTECERVRAAALDDEARERRIHARRYLRHGTGPDGSWWLSARGTVRDGAEILAGLHQLQRQAWDAARDAGLREPYDALVFDQLLAMARHVLACGTAGCGTCAPRDDATAAATAGDGEDLAPVERDEEPVLPSLLDDRPAPPTTTATAATTTRRRRARTGPRGVVRIVVDWSALVRGETAPGEVCEIPGVGPVPVARARELLGDALLEVVLAHGVDVRAVATPGRHVARKLRIALEQRDRCCVGLGCASVGYLEVDHARDWAKGGMTELENLDLACAHHHDLKTHHGWRVVVTEAGRRLLVPPDWTGPDPP
jgi:hypothetical protein